MPTRLRTGLAATVLLSTALMSGCGGDDGDGGDGGDSGSDFTKQSAEEMSDAAKKAMGDLKGVTIDGSLSADGQDITIDMALGEGGNCTGSFSTQGATAEILGVDGKTWFKPDAAFWELSVGPELAPQIIEAAGDNWVTLPDDDTSFKPFCDLEQFLDELVGDDEEEDATYTKGETKEIDGEETIEIISERPEDGKSSGYVRVDGDHYLVQISKTEGDEPGEVTFGGFDEQPDVEAPADDEQVELADLEAAGS